MAGIEGLLYAILEKYGGIRPPKVCAHAVILSVKGADFFVVGNR
jgi:hypothetical protein